MEITVELHHSRLRERVGGDRLTLGLEDGATVGEVLGELERRAGRLAPAGLDLLTAVDGVQAAHDHRLIDGDRVAVLLGMSGG
ncbi:MAG: MoaD/ThiS family protein [Solirubrobacterales bacterium]